ncbi:MAG TPA: RDD family protein [Myxococcota bacterium]|nr:RDD family protein [Myxococcota bacterium]
MIDTLHFVETPEGVRVALRLAGPVPRALAFLVDGSLRSVGYLLAGITFAVTLPQLGMPLLVLVVFVGEWFYPVLFEVLADGQTVGKRAVGIRVVHEDGTRIRWSASLLRNLLLWADGLPGTYAVGLVSMLASEQFRRLGDLAAGTLVIHTSPPPRASGALPEVVPLPPPVPLGVEQQRAVVSYAERAALFSPARADELAALPAALVADAPVPRERLLRIAAWLRGQRGGPGA